MGQRTETDSYFSEIKDMFVETYNKEEVGKNPDLLYGILNRVTDFRWNYELKDMRFSNVDTECHAMIVLDIGRKMIGVGSSTEKMADNIQEDAIRNAILNALEKMVSIHEDREEREHEKESIPIIRKETVQETVQETAQEEIPESTTPEKPKKIGVFTSRQVEKMIQFKEDFRIMNDEQLLAHLKTWNPRINSKTDLNSENIEDFFRYVDSLSEEVF